MKPLAFLSGSAFFFLFLFQIVVIQLKMNKNSQIVPGMRPWKSKEGRPLVNPEGKPAAYSGFLLGVAEAPNEAGAAGR